MIAILFYIEHDIEKKKWNMLRSYTPLPPPVILTGMEN